MFNREILSCFDLIDQATLNPVSRHGEYKWKQIDTDAGTLAILVNASISSQLPYTERNLTLKLNSDTQNQILDPSSDFIEFKFNLTDPKRTDYLLTVIFKTYENSTILLMQDDTIEYTSTERVTIAPRTTPSSMGNKQYLCNSFFLVFFIIFALL